MFGSDFWKILRFFIAILKLLGEMFGDDNDREQIKQNNL